MPSQTISLPTGRELTVGRSPECWLGLRDDLVSRVHAEFIQDGGRLLVRDRGSRNGTIVNGQAIDKGALKCGDELFLGKYTIVYLDESSHGFWNGQPVDSLAPYMGAQYDDDEDNTYEISPEMLRQMQAAT